MGAEAELDRIRGPWCLEEGDALLRLVGRRWRGADGMGDAECGWGRSAWMGDGRSQMRSVELSWNVVSSVEGR